MPETETTTTVVGEVQFETETCANCQNKVMAEDAITIHIDPYETGCKRSFCSASRPMPKADSFLCDYCADAIFGYSRGGLARDWIKQSITRLDTQDKVFVLAMSVLAATLIAIILLGALA